MDEIERARRALQRMKDLRLELDDYGKQIARMRELLEEA